MRSAAAEAEVERGSASTLVPVLCSLCCSDPTAAVPVCIAKSLLVVRCVRARYIAVGFSCYSGSLCRFIFFPLLRRRPEERPWIIDWRDARPPYVLAGKGPSTNPLWIEACALLQYGRHKHRSNSGFYQLLLPTSASLAVMDGGRWADGECGTPVVVAVLLRPLP